MPYVFEDESIQDASPADIANIKPGAVARFENIKPEDQAKITARFGVKPTGRYVFEDATPPSHIKAKIPQVEEPSFLQKLAVGPVGDIAAQALDIAAAPMEAATAITGGTIAGLAKPIAALGANLGAMATGRNPREDERTALSLAERAIPYLAYEPQSKLAKTAVAVASSPFTVAQQGLEMAGVPEDIAGPAVEFGGLILPFLIKAAKPILGIGKTETIAKAAAGDPAKFIEQARASIAAEPENVRVANRAADFEAAITQAERLRRSPQGAELLKRQLAAEEKPAPSPLPGTKEGDFAQRAAEIDRQMTVAERLRQSPRGATQLAESLKEQQTQGMAESLLKAQSERADLLEAENAKLREQADKETVLKEKQPPVPVEETANVPRETQPEPPGSTQPAPAPQEAQPTPEVQPAAMPVSQAPETEAPADLAMTKNAVEPKALSPEAADAESARVEAIRKGIKEYVPSPTDEYATPKERAALERRPYSPEAATPEQVDAEMARLKAQYEQARTQATNNPLAGKPPQMTREEFESLPESKRAQLRQAAQAKSSGLIEPDIGKVERSPFPNISTQAWNELSAEGKATLARNAESDLQKKVALDSAVQIVSDPSATAPQIAEARKILKDNSVDIGSVKNQTLAQLFKRAFTEEGSIGHLTPEQIAREQAAREARREIYQRIYDYARRGEMSFEQAARDLKIRQRDMLKLRTEAAQQRWNPDESGRPFTPLERAMGKGSEAADIFKNMDEEWKGLRLNNETTRKITESAIQAYQAQGRTLDPDIPVTVQIARDIAQGTIKQDPRLSEMLIATASNAGKQLQHMSQIQRILERSGVQIPGFTPEPPSAWDLTKEFSRRWINIWKGSLVSQMSTAIRNLETQAVRVGIDGIEKVVDAGIRQMLKVGEESDRGLSPGFGKAIETWSSLLRSGKREQAMQILNIFPDQKNRMFWQYSSDINARSLEPRAPLSGVAAQFDSITKAAETGIEYANFLNQGQEYLVRKAAFRSKLADILTAKGQNIDAVDPPALDVKDITASVDHALDITFAVTPQKGVGKWMMDLYRVVPPLAFIAPFPRFMWNSWKFFSDYSPTGFLKLLSPQEIKAIASGAPTENTTRILSRAIIGTGMLGAAYMLRNSDMAGEKWYEIQVGDKTFDTRPYNPFASYLFVADLVKKSQDGTLDRLGFKDITQGLLSANFRAGTGLFMLDKVTDMLGGLVANSGADLATRDVKRAVGETLGGFLTPLQTFRDVLSDERILQMFGQEGFAKEEAKLRDVAEEPLVGPLKARIPGLSQTLPERQFPMGRVAEREEPALRQVTGLIMREKTPVQKETDRLGFSQIELFHSTGIPKLDRLTAETMRPIVESTIGALIANRQYRDASDLQKRIWIKKWMGEIGSQARQRTLAQNRDLRIEYMIKSAGADQGKLLRQRLERQGLVSPQ